MKVFRTIPLLLALLPALHGRAGAQIAEPTPVPRPGTEYYVAFMQNQDRDVTESRFMGVMISSAVATMGQVEYRDPISSAQITRPFTVSPGAVTSIEIPRSLEMREEKAQPAVHITSRDPISVFVVNSRSLSTGAFVAVPVDLWKSTYLPMTLPNAKEGNSGEFTVIAAYDNTVVTIYPSARTQYREKGEQLDVVLRKGETVFLQGRTDDAGEDLSASDIISASQPVGVITGHVQTSIAPDRSAPLNIWGSHQLAMLLPDSLWGTEYYTVPMRSGGDRFRMMAASNGTQVTITHFPPGGSAETVKVTLQRGQMYDSSTVNGKPITGPVLWSATGPVMLMQLRTSGPYIDNNVSDPENSPMMAPVVATSQYSTYSVFLAPGRFSHDPFTTHTLTVVGKGATTGDPLGGVRVDGDPLATVDPALIVNRIGTSDYYYTRVRIDSGSHILTSENGLPFTARLNGNSGPVARDFYGWTAPFWSPTVSADVVAPHLAAGVSVVGNKLTVVFSDSTQSYFSGIAGVAVTNSPGWKISGAFVPPSNPDLNATVTFAATTDPSGPLEVEVTDRAGNTATIRLSDGICVKTAYAERDSMTIHTRFGAAKSDTMAVNTNPCGDSANVSTIDAGNGDAASHINAHFEGAIAPPFTIAAHGSMKLVVEALPGTPIGTYTTTIAIGVDGSTIRLPFTLVVEPLSSVDDGIAARTISVRPNPFSVSVTLGFERPLGEHARVTVSDRLGRVVREIAGGIAGRTELAWDGVDGAGVQAPAGLYFISVEDAGRTIVRSVTLLR
jgi:hypothetical protein